MLGKRIQADTIRPDWLDDIADIELNTISFHLAHPEPLPDKYIRKKNIELGKCVLKKYRVYLDQKYWIYCRDASTGSSKFPIHNELYNLLKKGVTEGKLICPASHLILEETLKQTDPATRQLTAQVVQELSDGVTLHPCPLLDQAEILHFLMTERPWKVNAIPVEQLVWTYVGNVFGHATPICNEFDNNTSNAIQKAWFDSMSRIKFTILASALPANKAVLHRPATFYEQQNEQCKEHRKDFTSFKEAFMIELDGALDIIKPLLQDAQLYHYEICMGKKSQNVSKEETEEAVRLFSNLIYNAFKMGKIERQLSGLRIMVGIHAAIRHKGQKFCKGDHHDHLHARTALPYCNLFLTEKNLGNLLTTKPLQYDSLYGCHIEWEPEKALDALKRILN